MRSKAAACDKIEVLSSFYDAYSCAEGVWRILLDVYDEPVSREFLKAGCVCRGGAGVGGRCGVVASAIQFLSYIGGRQSPDEDYEALLGWSRKIHEAFQTDLGAYDCEYLWAKVEQEIQDKYRVEWDQCVIREGLLSIRGLVHDAYVDLKGAKQRVSLESGVDMVVPEQSVHASIMSYSNEAETLERVLAGYEVYVENGLTCSEAALRALLDGFGIEWSEREKQVATVYARGSGVGDRCGVLEAALQLLSVGYGRIVRRVGDNEDRMLSIVLHQKVASACGSCFCRDLTDMHEGVERECPVARDVLRVCTSLLCSADGILREGYSEFCALTKEEFY